MKQPNILTGLGTVTQLEIVTNDEEIMQFSFLVKHNYQLATNSQGTVLFIFPGRKLKTTSADPDKIANKLERAERMFTKWSEFEADSVAAYQISEKPLRTVGTAYSITYRSDKWSGKMTPYIHHFTSPARVKMDDIDHPRLIQVFGGRMKVKAEGIVG